MDMIVNLQYSTSMTYFNDYSWFDLIVFFFSLLCLFRKWIKSQLFYGLYEFIILSNITEWKKNMVYNLLVCFIFIKYVLIYLSQTVMHNTCFIFCPLPIHPSNKWTLTFRSCYNCYICTECLHSKLWSQFK